MYQNEVLYIYALYIVIYNVLDAARFMSSAYPVYGAVFSIMTGFAVLSAAIFFSKDEQRQAR
jgi:hypothetical protein